MCHSYSSGWRAALHLTAGIELQKAQYISPSFPLFSFARNHPFQACFCFLACLIAPASSRWQAKLVWSCLSQCSPHCLLGLGTRGTPRSAPAGGARGLEPHMGPNHTARHLAPGPVLGAAGRPLGPQTTAPCACPPLFQPGAGSGRGAGAVRVTFLSARECNAGRGGSTPYALTNHDPSSTAASPCPSPALPVQPGGAHRALPLHSAPRQGRGTRACAR